MTKNVHAVPLRVTAFAPRRAALDENSGIKMARTVWWHERCSSRLTMHATNSSAFDSRQRRAAAGFTLIELMIVVAIMGILATLATYGVRKYIMESKRSEAVSMLTEIRAAEEAYRDERFVYLGLDEFKDWHPTSDPGGVKSGWESGVTAMTPIFAELGVVSDGPVEYSYGVVAGTVGSAVPAIPMPEIPPLPAPEGPFYIAMAKGDLNNDGKYTYAFCHSDSNRVALDDNY